MILHSASEDPAAPSAWGTALPARADDRGFPPEPSGDVARPGSEKELVLHVPANFSYLDLVRNVSAKLALFEKTNQTHR